MTLEVLCPAKLNLFLAVGPKDSIGYHPLRTIFQAIDIFDILEIETDTESTQISCDWADLPTDNTLAKALRLVGEIGKIPPLKLVLKKRIPVESGLGGGSSNAAGLLRALPKLGIKILPHELLEVAAAVGADVPFFLVGGRAKGEGYGEQLAPLPDGPQRHFVIARPQVGCATGRAYAALDAQQYEWKGFPEQEAYYNDFERVAPGASLDLIERLRRLGAVGAALSGSGSAVFGEFNSAELAAKVAAALKGDGDAEIWTAKSLDRAASVTV